MNSFLKSILVITSIYLGACSSSSDSAAPPSVAQNSVSALMKSVSNTLASATASSAVTPFYFTTAAAIQCSEGGFYDDHMDPSWAAKQIYCLTRTQGNGPDTLLGAFTQAQGFVCSIGSLTFDGVERAATMNVTTSCFSQGMVDMIKTEFGKTSFAVDVTAMDLTSTHKIGTVVVNSVWTKALQVKFGTDLAAKQGSGLTILVKDDAGAKAVAVYDGLVLENETNGVDVFAVYVNPGASGNIAYEARVDTQRSNSFSRHLRLYLGGSINADDLVASDMKDMAFVWADGANSSSNDYAMYASMLGTPAAGRKVISQYNNSGSWQNQSGDGECYGEVGATCTGNSGISKAGDSKFFFKDGSSYTTSYNWFIQHSYLSHFGMNMTMDDIHP